MTLWGVEQDESLKDVASKVRELVIGLLSAL